MIMDDIIFYSILSNKWKQFFLSASKAFLLQHYNVQYEKWTLILIFTYYSVFKG